MALPTGRLPVPYASAISRVALAGCALLAVIILTSAYLRLAAMGLGCEPWPDCYARSFNAGVPAESAAIAGARLAHRIAASTVAVLAVLLLLLTLDRRGRSPCNLRLGLSVTVVTVLLAVIGKAGGGSPPPWIAFGNLAGGQTLLALLWWLYLENRPAAPENEASNRFARTVLALLAVQLVLGALTSVLQAATACSGFPACEISPSEAPGLAVLHMLHRAGGVAVLLLLFALAAKQARAPRRRAAGACIGGLAAGTFTLGVASVVLHLPLALVVLHNAAAAALLLAVIAAARSSPRHDRDRLASAPTGARGHAPEARA